MPDDAPTAHRPLLGVAGRWGDAEVRLAARFEELHQLIYMHGGISPTNAALEELAKLIFLRLWALREPNSQFGRGLPAAELFAPQRPIHDASVFKEAFTAALKSDALKGARPDGTLDSLWPSDEPFRLSNDRVLAAAVDIVRDTVDHESTSVSDPLGTAFDALLSGKYDHAGGLGTYLTPSAVATMMAEIAVESMATNRVGRPAVGFGDPFCGTGRFLVALLETLADDPRACARRLAEAGVFGADQSTSAVAKARLNMLLYGIDQPRVWTVKDSIVDPALDRWASTVPLILTNPPFGENKYSSPEGIARTGRAIPSLARAKRIDPAIACLVRSLELLAPDGILGIILPDGVVESRAFDELLNSRAGRLAGEAFVIANVSLPTATFSLSGTVAKTSAVFIRRARRVDRVMLARVEHVGFTRQAGRAAPDPDGNQLPTVAAVFKRTCAKPVSSTLALESTDPLVAIAAADSIQSLDPSRLDPEAMEARRRLSEDGGIELRELVSVQRPRRARSVDIRPFVSVLHVDELGNIDWGEAAEYSPTTPGVLVKGGDLIVSLLNPAKLRAAVIPEHCDRVQVSAEFGVFSARHAPHAILALLYSDRVRCQLRPLGRGTSSSRRRIDPEDVLSLVVPKLDEATIRKLDDRMREAYEAVANGRHSLRSTISDVLPAGRPGRTTVDSGPPIAPPAAPAAPTKAVGRPRKAAKATRRKDAPPPLW